MRQKINDTLDGKKRIIAILGFFVLCLGMINPSLKGTLQEFFTPENLEQVYNISFLFVSVLGAIGTVDGLSKNKKKKKEKKEENGT